MLSAIQPPTGLVQIRNVFTLQKDGWRLGDGFVLYRFQWKKLDDRRLSCVWLGYAEGYIKNHIIEYRQQLCGRICPANQKALEQRFYLLLKNGFSLWRIEQQEYYVSLYISVPCNIPKM